jgi:predicted secreted protein
MANTLQIKRRTSAGVPSGLAAGELAVNLSDSKLYVGNAAANGVIQLNPSIGGTLTSTGDFTIDSADGIVLDAGGDTISLKDDGLRFGILQNSSSDFVIQNPIDDKDILFKIKDGGTVKTALTLDGSANGNATLSGNLTLATSLSSASGDLELHRAGSNRLTLSGSSVVINDLGQNIDFRVEGDGDANLIRTDASNDRVGIKTNAPAYTFHCVGTGYFSQAVTLSSGLTVSGTANFGGSYTNFGGGYGATGVSITSAGNIQANGTLTVDAGLSVAGSSSFQGASFTSAITTSSTVSISSGTNKLLVLNPAISTGGSLTSIAFQRGGTDKWRVFQYEADTKLSFYNDISSLHQFALNSDGSCTFGGAITATGGTINSAGNGELTVSRTSGAAVLTQAQSAAGRIGTTTNHDLQLMTNSTVYARLTNDGRFGIGCDPDSKLEIAGGDYNTSLKIKGGSGNTGIQFEDSGGTTDGYIYAAALSVGFLDEGGSWTIQCKNDDYIRFATNGNTERMRLTSAGRLGINTSAPDSLLNVFSSTQRQLSFYAGTSPSGNNYVAALKLGRGQASNSALEIKYDSEGSEHAYISRLYSNAVLHFDKSGTDHMTISAAGTVTVNNNLTVAGSCTFAALSGTTATFSGAITSTGLTIGSSTLSGHSSGSTYGLQVKSNHANASALEFKDSGNNWLGTLYAAKSGSTKYIGFLDAPWGNWDVKKTVNGVLEIDQGSGLETVFTTAGGTLTGNLSLTNSHLNLSHGYSLQWADSHERIEATNSTLKFFTNNGQQMTLSGSNLGIGGVTAPDSKIHALTSGSTYAAQFETNSTTPYGVYIEASQGPASNIVDGYPLLKIAESGTGGQHYFSVSSGGATTITGTLQVTPTASEKGITIGDASKGEVPLIFKGSGGSHSIGQNGAGFFISENNAGNLDGSPRLSITGAGDISFYEDTGTTAKFYWSAANERLNLSASDYQLQLTSGSHIWFTKVNSSGSFAIHRNGVGDILSMGTAGSDINAHTHFRPYNNNQYTCGTSANRWSSVISTELNLTGQIKSSSTTNQFTNNEFEKVIQVGFGHGTANQKMDFYWTGTQSFWGRIEVEVTDSYSNQNASGSVKAVYGVGVNANNAVYNHERHYTESTGSTGDNWALSDLRWDSSNSRYRITLVHRTSTGNSPTLKFKFFGTNATYRSNIEGFTNGSVYTSDSTSYEKPSVMVGVPGNRVDLNVQGNTSVSGDGKRLFVNSNDRLLCTLGNWGGSGADIDEGHLAMYSSGSETVRIATNADSFFNGGNVGIGVTPSRKLDVDGKILGDGYGFRSDSSAKWYYFDDFSGSNFIGRGSNSYTALYDSGVLTMSWNSGKVGINHNNPQASIHTHATSGHNSSYITTDGNSSSNAALWFAHNYSSAADWAGVIWGSDDLLRLTCSGSSNSSHFVLNKSGNIGINCTPSSFKLDVNGTARIQGNTELITADHVILDLNTNAGNHYTMLRFSPNGTQNTYIRSQTNKNLIFDNSSGTQRMVLKEGGYVDMAGASQVRLTLGSTGTAGTNNANWVRSSGANLEFNAASGDFNWEVGGVHRMRLTDTGSLGIGLGAGDDPTSNIHVGVSGADQASELRLDGSNGSSQACDFIIDSSGATGNVNFKYNIGGGSPSTRMILNTAGLKLPASHHLYFQDGNTYLAKGSNNSLLVVTNSGWIQIAPQNSSFCHFMTDRPSFYFNKQTYFEQNIGPYADAVRDSGAYNVRWLNTFSVRFRSGDGSAGNPGITFINDLNTGLYRSAGDTMHLVSGGNSRMSVSNSGIRFHDAYTFPTSIGSSGQVLKVPSSGTTLEWGSGGSGSGTVNETHGTGTDHEVAVHLGSSTVGEGHKLIYNETSGLTVNNTSSQTDSTYALYVSGGIKNSTGGLYISGDGYISSRLGVATAVDTSYGIKVAGYIASYGHTTWSDQRLKDDTALWDTSEAALLVKDVPVYSYKWNDKCDAKKIQTQDRIGFLAHEVEEKINKNNLVVTSTHVDRYKSVNQTDMIPILWAALQDALKRIEELENK